MPLASLPSRKYRDFEEIILESCSGCGGNSRLQNSERKYFRCLCILRLVFEVVVVDGLGATQVINPDYEGSEILERANGP